MGIRAIAKVKKGVATVKLLVKHAMESGMSGKKPAKFINHLTVEHNGKVVFDMFPTAAVSKNPYIKFKFKGANKGEIVSVEWTDNTGASETKEVKLK